MERGVEAFQSQIRDRKKAPKRPLCSGQYIYCLAYAHFLHMRYIFDWWLHKNSTFQKEGLSEL